MREFKVGDRVVAIKNPLNDKSLEVGRLYTIEGTSDDDPRLMELTKCHGQEAYCLKYEWPRNIFVLESWIVHESYYNCPLVTALR